jgi:predicted O-methyltransferase YrrM
VRPGPVPLRERARRVYALRFLHGKLTAVWRYWPVMRAHPVMALRFLLTDPELDNYTYDLANIDELVDTIARTFGAKHEQVAGLVRELEDDTAFRAELSARLRAHRGRKPRPLYGRRIGWYCIVRLVRPRVVIEAGVHDGLSAIFLRALEHNRSEGFPGKLIGIDVDPTCGWLVPDRLRSHFDLVVDDSVAYLRRISGSPSIGLFLHDSLHTYSHETAEYEAALAGLEAGGLILSDDAHATPALADFSNRHGRPYVFWHERPINHFYPGAGIGMSLPERAIPGSPVQADDVAAR